MHYQFHAIKNEKYSSFASEQNTDRTKCDFTYLDMVNWCLSGKYKTCKYRRTNLITITIRSTRTKREHVSVTWSVINLKKKIIFHYTSLRTSQWLNSGHWNLYKQKVNKWQKLTSMFLLPAFSLMFSAVFLLVL